MAFLFIKDRIPTRAVIWVMLFTCTCFLYVIRTNLSIIILAMTEPIVSNTTVTSTKECSAETGNNSYVNSNNDSHMEHAEHLDYGIRYNWDKKLQGVILGAYFWGFAITGIPGGALAERYGPAKCITISFVVSGILTLFIPLTTNLSMWFLIISRFIIGLFAGVVYPSLHCLVSRWAPPDEKGKFVGALLGGALGSVITWPLMGSIIESLGWTWAFYISGILVTSWTFLWFLCVYDSPDAHPRISEVEKKHIIDSLGENVKKSEAKKLPPYKSIALSIPFWALLILHFGNLWGLFFLMTAGPNFMSTVLGFNLGHTGILAALPYLARLIFGFLFGQIGDVIIKRNLMGKTTIRKSFVLFSHILPGCLLFAQTLTGCDVSWAIVLITLSLGSNGASTLTNLQNSQDLAPNFAGTIYGIINCVGSTTGFISPLIVGYLTDKHNGFNEWHIVFYIGASVYIASGVVFCIFGSADVQPWNDIEEGSNKEIEGIENIAFEGVETKKENGSATK